MIAPESITQQEKALCTQQPGHRDCVTVLLFGSHKRKASRRQRSLQERQLIHERRRADRERDIKIPLQRELHARHMDEEATQTVRDMDVQTKTMLEEQRSGPTNQANYGLNLQEMKAANTVQSLEQHLRQQYMELCRRSHDCEASRNGQLLLLAELRDREHAHQEALSLLCPKRWKN